MMNAVKLLVLLCFILASCPSHAATAVKTGAKVLSESGFLELRGKRIGLITNHTAMVDGTPLADLMHAGGVQLVAIFAPEHGFGGLGEDGENIADRVDKSTGVPIYSLYGKAKAPSPEILHRLDLLLFDIQCVGTRFYTYISTMGLAMQAAAAAHVPFMVLDRPDPLGGDYFAGPLLKPGYISFVGEYPIPIAHGMTIGELAMMIKGEHMLPGLEGLELCIVRMEGWKREMQWPEDGLAWVKTSPNIPDFETALLYPGVCLLEGTAASVGRGTEEPFKLVGFPGIDPDEFAERLSGMNPPGVTFEPAFFTPRSIPGMSSDPKFNGEKVAGIKIHVTNPRAFHPVETGVQIVCALYDSLDQKERETFFRQSGFDELAGTHDLRLAIESGATPEEIIAGWQKDLESFAAKRSKYLLYQ